MRRYATTPPPAPEDGRRRRDLDTIRSLLPYLWTYKWRMFIALACMVGAKGANVAVPLVFKQIIDALAPAASSPELLAAAPLLVPLGLLAAYGVLRFSTSLLTEVRELVFVRVTQQTVRRLALQVFRHLHALSLRFHLERQTGGLTRDIERGTRAIGSLISYTLYSILPTLIEIALVIGILATRYAAEFALITLVMLTLYIVFTVTVTNWRTAHRRAVNELDSAANIRAVDSLLNYETVKYFNNEDFESRRYDDQLSRWQRAQERSQVSLSLLNVGQALIIATGVMLMMWRATVGVAEGRMTLGDIVLVNAFMIQLYIPLNFLGVLYREIRQSLTDIERMFSLLDTPREVTDKPDASALPAGPCAVRFQQVNFGYEPSRQILHDIDFTIPAGGRVAVVGHSGSGKSTLARLLYRFYDIDSGHITINGVDLRSLTQDSLRSAIGIVPQDTVLFNDSIHYNIQYGRVSASAAEVEAASRAAQLHDFVMRLPDGYATTVGERGLKLSGGEKQRVAIARALLKNPPVLIFDEATSALDSKTEQAIQSQLEQVARGHTTLIIAHRLSTIMDADQILVMDAGRIIERGSHAELLALDGAYSQMWALQAQEEAEQPGGLDATLAPV
jgi:ATP-binding cassette, subfamily B, heavy metal transporter